MRVGDLAVAFLLVACAALAPACSEAASERAVDRGPGAQRAAGADGPAGFAGVTSGPEAADRAGEDGRASVPEARSSVGSGSLHEGYVGADRCASCHPKEAGRWRGSHHDLAMQPATPETVLGDFDDARFDHDGVTTRFRRVGDAFVVETRGADGVSREYPVAYTFGVQPLQQYLVPFPDGRMQVLGASWDSRPADEGGQRWFHVYGDEHIPPGDLLHWTEPAQTWNYMCAVCHSTDLHKGYDARTDTYDTTWAEIDVACEACHGPGARHVDWAEAVATEGTARTATAPDGAGDTPGTAGTRGTALGLPVDLGDVGEGFWRFADGAPTAERTAPRTDDPVASCVRCHARGTPLREPSEVGRPLLDNVRLSTLDETLYHADGQPREEVYVYGSFLQSKMARKGVVCTDCHDPHAGDVYVDGNALCAQCHRAEVFDVPSHHHHEPGTPGAACVDCHMPAQPFMQIDDRREHAFRVPRPDLSGPLGAPNACNGCHADRSAGWADAAITGWHGPERAMHFGTALHAGRVGGPGARAALEALVADAEQPGIARASAWTLLAGLPGMPPRPLLEAALADPDALVRAAALDVLDGAPADVLLPLAAPGIDDAVRLVRLESARLLASLPDAALPASFGEAYEELLASERGNADRPEGRFNLGNILAARGDLEGARAAFESALELEPRHVPAWVNLADVVRAVEGEDACGGTLERGLEVVPGDGDLSYAFGLHHVRARRLDAALPLLEQAARRRQDLPRFAYAYGLALQAAGRGVDGALTLEQALSRHPYDQDLLIGLVSIWADLGERARARAFAERLAALAPDDPRAQALLDSLR